MPFFPAAGPMAPGGGVWCGCKGVPWAVRGASIRRPTTGSRWRSGWRLRSHCVIVRLHGHFCFCGFSGVTQVAATCPGVLCGFLPLSVTSAPPVKVIFSWATKFPPKFRALAVLGSARDDPADIVHAVALIPDSLQIWFYWDKRHEAGKAFGCWVRVGDLDPAKQRSFEAGENGCDGE